MTAPAPRYAATASPALRRRALGTVLLLAVLALAGCTGTGTDAGSATSTATSPAAAPSATPTTPTASPSVVPSRPPSGQVTGGGERTAGAAEAILELDGSRVGTGNARCARAIDESTDHPAILLVLASADQKQNAEVVVTDGSDPTVISAVVMRDGGATLAGAEGLDGSTLRAERKGDAFSISGTVKDQSDASTHELRLETTCVGL